MRADAYPLETVLGEGQQWVVPVYQRHYEWDTGEERQLPKLAMRFRAFRLDLCAR
jgi:hypothetical protein